MCHVTDLSGFFLYQLFYRNISNHATPIITSWPNPNLTRVIPNVKWKPSGENAMFTFWFQVSCGKYHAVALTEAGQLYAWGSNYNGQLLQANNPSPTATQLDLDGKMYVQLLRDKYALGFDVFFSVLIISCLLLYSCKVHVFIYP